MPDPVAMALALLMLLWLLLYVRGWLRLRRRVAPLASIYRLLVFLTATALVGVALLSAVLFFATPWIEAHYGIALNGLNLSGDDATSLAELLGWILLAGSVASLLPGLRAYRLSLIDGLTPRT